MGTVHNELARMMLKYYKQTNKNKDKIKIAFLLTRIDIQSHHHQKAS